jgi:hypothetical protein
MGVNQKANTVLQQIKLFFSRTTICNLLIYMMNGTARHSPLPTKIQALLVFSHILQGVTCGGLHPTVVQGREISFELN